MINRVYSRVIKILDQLILSIFNFFEKLGFVKPIQYKIERPQNDIQKVDHSFPVNFDKKDESLFNEWKRYTTCENKLFALENVFVSGKGIIFKGFQCFVPALPNPVFKGEFGFLHSLKYYLFKKKFRLPSNEKYLIVIDHWAHQNYYHWMVDSMCRLLFWRDILNDHTILVNENAPNYIMDTLHLLQVKNIATIDPNTYFSVPNLTIPNYCAWSGQQHPLVLKKVREFILDHVHGGNNFERIYVSRGRQKTRRVANESELIEVLKQNNFHIVYFEGMSVAEQVSLVKNVKYFVSSHGANMTNAMFLKNARVLELITKEKPNFCYWSVLSNLGIPYYYQLCDVESKDHLYVDIEQFKVNLQKLLND